MARIHPSVEHFVPLHKDYGPQGNIIVKRRVKYVECGGGEKAVPGLALNADARQAEFDAYQDQVRIAENEHVPNSTEGKDHIVEWVQPVLENLP